MIESLQQLHSTAETVPIVNQNVSVLMTGLAKMFVGEVTGLGTMKHNTFSSKMDLR